MIRTGASSRYKCIGSSVIAAVIARTALGISPSETPRGQPVVDVCPPALLRDAGRNPKGVCSYSLYFIGRTVGSPIVSSKCP